MTLVDARPELDADAGFAFSSNCPICGGGWQLEGASLGREDLPRPCTEVKQVVYCAACNLRMLLEVNLKVISDGRRNPGRLR